MKAKKWHLFSREAARLCNGGNFGLQTKSEIKYTALLQIRRNLVEIFLNYGLLCKSTTFG